MAKTIKKGAAALAAVFLLTLSPAAAEGPPRQLVPVGAAIGVHLETDGLLVIGMSELETSSGSRSPAFEAGIRSGDLILEVGDVRVATARQLREALESETGEVSVRFLREGREMQVTVCPERGEDGQPELGVWLRSGLSGIGTMTWYDPASGRFGALGHAVSDVDTGVLLPMKSGIVGKASVDSILRGSAGTPGELKGSMGLEKPFGSILENREAGIFGVLEPGALPETMGEAVELCPLGELRCGPAEILSDVSGRRESYSARVLRVYPGGGSRDLLIQVTDERLIRLTGGIVQGMSGSPILQGGRLAGAVTHVLVSDPTKGYGISIEDMLDAAETADKAA
ncbi:MAG: PDZ domain-containing protein [Oscillospiraceae bacterium]|nr:PDZ domain-containing protein [Oscillospiraceae bacterium]